MKKISSWKRSRRKIKYLFKFLKLGRCVQKLQNGRFLSMECHKNDKYGKFILLAEENPKNYRFFCFENYSQGCLKIYNFLIRSSSI
jgi:hypothetical protein